MSSAQGQGRLWGAAAREWAELAEPVQAPFFEAALDALGIETAALLDAEGGAGLALVLAARRGAVVTGLDASAGLLAVARERLPAADVREGDLEALPYEDDSFDAVTAFNSIQYAGDPTAALREIKRVVRSGQRVAIRTTWGRPQECEMRAVQRAIGSLLPPPPPGAGGAFALAAPGALEALIKGAGLTPERSIDVPTPYTHHDFETAVRSHLSSGPARRAIDTAGLEATREQSPRCRRGPPAGRVGHLRQRLQSPDRARVELYAASPGVSSGCEASLNSRNSPVTT